MQNVGNNVSLLPLRMVSTVGMWGLSELSRGKNQVAAERSSAFDVTVGR